MGEEGGGNMYVCIVPIHRKKKVWGNGERSCEKNYYYFNYNIIIFFFNNFVILCNLFVAGGGGGGAWA